MVYLYALLIILGLIIIFKGGGLLVNSSLKLSKLLGLSPLFVGAVLVSLLTTIPELIITFVSVARGFTGLAVGDAIGTIIFNTCVILGVALTFGGITRLSKKYNVKLVFLIVAAILCFIFALGGVITWYLGIVLLLIYVGFTWYNLKEAKKEFEKERKKQEEQLEGLAYKETVEELSTQITGKETIETATKVESRDLKNRATILSKNLENAEKIKDATIDFTNTYEHLQKSIQEHEKIVNEEYEENLDELKQKKRKEKLKAIIMFLLSGALVAAGAYLLVEFGQRFAYSLNISEDIVGLLILGVGSSLPELVTCIQAIKKKTVELSIGNVIGANVMNLGLLIGGGAIASISGLPIIKETMIVSFPVMLVGILILGLSLLTKKHIAKKQGIILLSIYAIYFIFSLLNIFLKIV